MQSNPRTTYPTQIPQSDDSDPNLHTQLVVRLLSGFGFHTPKQLYLKFSRVRVLSDCCRVSHLRLVPRILLMAVFSGGEHLWCPNISFILFHSLFCLLIDCFLHFLASFLHLLPSFLLLPSNLFWIRPETVVGYFASQWIATRPFQSKVSLLPNQKSTTPCWEGRYAFHWKRPPLPLPIPPPFPFPLCISWAL